MALWSRVRVMFVIVVEDAPALQAGPPPPLPHDLITVSDHVTLTRTREAFTVRQLHVVHAGERVLSQIQAALHDIAQLQLHCQALESETLDNPSASSAAAASGSRLPNGVQSEHSTL